jgi:hypothetical protein
MVKSHKGNTKKLKKKRFKFY